MKKLPDDIMANIFSFLPYNDRIKFERLNKKTHMVAGTHQWMLWKLNGTNDNKILMKENFKTRIKKFPYIIQRFFLDNTFCGEKFDKLEELLIKSDYKAALLYLGVLTKEEIKDIENVLGHFFTSECDWSFYIFAQKLVTHAEIMACEKARSHRTGNNFLCLSYDGSISSLKQNLVTYKHIHLCPNPSKLLCKKAYDAMQKKLITADHLTMTCEFKAWNGYMDKDSVYGTTMKKKQGHLLHLISNYGIYALEKKLLTPEQASHIGGLEYLLTEKGIEALEMHWITPEEAAEFIHPTSLDLLLNNGSDALRDHRLTVKDAIWLSNRGFLESHLTELNAQNKSRLHLNYVHQLP